VRDQAAAEADAAVAAVDEAWRKASDRDRENAGAIAKSGVSVDEEKAAWVNTTGHFRMPRAARRRA